MIEILCAEPLLRPALLWQCSLGSELRLLSTGSQHAKACCSHCKATSYLSLSLAGRESGEVSSTFQCSFVAFETPFHKAIVDPEVAML